MNERPTKDALSALTDNLKTKHVEWVLWCCLVELEDRYEINDENRRLFKIIEGDYWEYIRANKE